MNTYIVIGYGASLMPPPGKWHSSWQGRFDTVEQSFEFRNERGQMCTRRADVVLNTEYVLEIQHSFISAVEVKQRHEDYARCGRKVVWLIDGNHGIEITHLNRNNRRFMEFKSHWKYAHFLDAEEEVVYYEIDGFVYSVRPQDIKGHMIDVEEPVSDTEFVRNILVEQHPLRVPTPPPQSRLFVEQKGAGNGKTFGIVQLARDPTFAHYDRLVYLTKQHSARHVILSEIRDQVQRGYIPEDYFDRSDLDSTTDSKQRMIRFANSRRALLIGTIDSFNYAMKRSSIAHGDFNGPNMFSRIADGIIEQGVDTDRDITYGGEALQLNKRTLLIGDEMQDLDVRYAKAIVKIMRDHYVDFYCVGDKLQSLVFENNAFTLLAGGAIPYTQCTVLPVSNVVRRFSHPAIVNFVNETVPFVKYGLPSVNVAQETTATQNQVTEPVRMVSLCGDTIRDVRTIMELYAREVSSFDRSPSDFMFVTPFVKNNQLMEAIHQEIREFWELRTDSEAYRQYSVFHKSEEGNSIDLSESDDATRIVSIHASKGDGRPVVFVVGAHEHCLNKFAETDSLVYDSLWHVAITRAKEHLYVALNSGYNDNISRRVAGYCRSNCLDFDTAFNLPIKLDVLQIVDTGSAYEMLLPTVIGETLHRRIADDLGSSSARRVVDMCHHNCRKSCMYIFSLLLIVESDRRLKRHMEANYKAQFCVMLKQLVHARVTCFETAREFHSALQTISKNIHKRVPTERIIPLYKLKHKGGDYDKIHQVIVRNVHRVRAFVRRFLYEDATLDELGFLECVVIFYMISVTQRGAETPFSISELYDVVHILHNADTSTRRLYIAEHYRSIELLRSQWNHLLEKHPNMNVLYNHKNTLHGHNDDYTLYARSSFVGYNDDTVVSVSLVSALSVLNCYDELAKSVFVEHLLRNPRGKENRARFQNKRVVHYVVTCDRSEPYRMDWGDKVVSHAAAIVSALRDKVVEHQTRFLSSACHFFAHHKNRLLEDGVKKRKLLGRIEKKYREMYPMYDSTQRNDWIASCFAHAAEECRWAPKPSSIVSAYDNREYLSCKLTASLWRSTDVYFGFREDTSDDESE